MKLDKILKRSLNIKPNEKVLIVTDKKMLKIAKKFFNASQKLSKNTELILKPIGKYPGEEPSKKVAEEMKKVDVLIAITKNSLSHTKARKAATKKRVRIATLPAFNQKMFKSLEESPFNLKKIGGKITKVLLKTKKIKILTPSGTKLSFLISRKTVDNDTGLYIKKGKWGNLPAGEAYAVPLEGTANGILIIDIMKNDKEIFAREGTKIIIEKGNAINISDKKNKLAKIFKKIKNSRNIAEFAIGTNSKARIIGNILEDEKVFGTCHIAFGNNSGIGGKVYSKVHLDTILFKPTIYADKKLIMKEGKLLI